MNKGYWILTILLGAWNFGNAQERRALTVEETIQIGLKNSKTLHASVSKVESSTARKDEVNAARLPSLKLSAGFTKLSTVPAQAFRIPANFFGPGLPASDITSTLSPTILNNYTLKATVEQKLFTGFRLESNSKVAKLTEQAVHEDYNKDKSELIYNIRNAYWSLFKAVEEKKVVDENIEQVKAHLKDARNLLAQSMVTNNDVLKVQVQLSNTQLLQIDAKNQVQIAAINLNNLIGLPLNTEVEIKSSIVHQAVEFVEAGTLINKAVQNRNDIKALEYRLRAGEASVTVAKSGWYPQVSLTGNYYYNRPNQRYFPLADEFRRSWDVGVTVNFDAWNWGTTKYQTRQAQSQLSQTKDALGTLKDGISLEVTQNYLTMLQAKEKIAVTRQSIEEAQESYRITSEKYKQGVVLTTDLLDAEVALLTAKTANTRALVDYELAQAKLLKAIGE